MQLKHSFYNVLRMVSSSDIEIKLEMASKAAPLTSIYELIKDFSKRL